MVKYSVAREYMESGDVLMLKSTGFISRMIRVLTGESINHVALILTNPSGVFVVEMREAIGWRLTPASQWLEYEIGRGKIVLWGQFPGELRGNVCHEVYAMAQREKPYSYWSLFTVWLSQIFRRWKLPANLVCSVFCQRDWLHCEYEMFPRLADPGDFVAHANDINRIVI